MRCTTVPPRKLLLSVIGATLLLLYHQSTFLHRGHQRAFSRRASEAPSYGAVQLAQQQAISSAETASVSEHRPRVALYWTTVFGSEDFAIGLGRRPFEGCPFSNCVATNNRSLLPIADGVLFHGRNMNNADLPSYRRPEQKFVFTLQESPIYAYLDWTGLDGFFNLSMTYKRDADIYYPYGETVKGRQNETLSNFSKRKPAAAWMASHCNSHSQRDKYVNELDNYIHVTKLGECGAQRCNGTAIDCYHQLAAENLFYLAFENSLCEDYITEKLWLALRVGMVPIVRGPSPETYRRVAPPHSFIHVREFAGPAALAAYLHRLAANRTAYGEYHEWRATHRVREPRPACDVCAELWKPAGGSRQLKISDMWSKKNCQRAKDVRVDSVADWLFILKTMAMNGLKVAFN